MIKWADKGKDLPHFTAETEGYWLAVWVSYSGDWCASATCRAIGTRHRLTMEGIKSEKHAKQRAIDWTASQG